jgi:hypothetical protein
MFQKMATDSRGVPWVTWQEFTGNDFDIFAASRTADGWALPLRISESRANDWDPALATAPDGTVYGLGQLRAGNYDVFVRSKMGAWAGHSVTAPQPRPIRRWRWTPDRLAGQEPGLNWERHRCPGN